MKIDPIKTNEDVAVSLGITPYEAHLLMHAIDEAYVIHSRSFTNSVLKIAAALMDERQGIVIEDITSKLEYSYVFKDDIDVVTLIFSWTHHKFYIMSLMDFVKQFGK
jgi:hypothetical protein